MTKRFALFLSSLMPVLLLSMVVYAAAFLSDASYRRYLGAIGSIESGNNYAAKNQFGCMGRFQFCPQGGKIYGYNPETFRTSAAAQDKVMREFSQYHYNVVTKNGIYKQFAKYAPGDVELQKELAMAYYHQQGQPRAEACLLRGQCKADGNGVTADKYVSNYLKAAGQKSRITAPVSAPPPGVTIPKKGSTILSRSTASSSLPGCDVVYSDRIKQNAATVKANELQPVVNRVLSQQSVSIESYSCLPRLLNSNAITIGDIMKNAAIIKANIAQSSGFDIRQCQSELQQIQNSVKNYTAGAVIQEINTRSVPGIIPVQRNVFQR